MDVQLIIKAPSQNVDDHTVNCNLNWSVQDLKSHLSQTYPLHPVIDEQRLIYSGRLLDNSLHLSEFLRNDEAGSNVYTLHLVCSASTFIDQDERLTSPDYNYGVVNTETQNVPRRRYNPMPPPNPAYDEYRRRQEMMIQSIQSGVNVTNVQLPAFSPDAQVAAQMAAMQQMYAYYFTQYIQSANSIQAYTMDNSTNNVVNDAVATQPLNQRVPGGQQQRAEENGHRDWLDHVFLCCRFLLLFCLVYFYSTPERLMIVIIGTILAFLYHEGWFVRGRGNLFFPAEEHLLQENQQNVHNPETDDNQFLANQEYNDLEELHNEHEIEATMDGENPPHANNPAPANHIHLCFNFLSSFFTSLIPDPPPPVNIN